MAHPTNADPDTHWELHEGSGGVPDPDAHSHRNAYGVPYSHAHAHGGPHAHSGSYPNCFPDRLRDHIWDAIFDTQARRDAAAHQHGGRRPVIA